MKESSMIKINPEELKELGRKISEFADDYKIQLDNMMWRVSLPSAEQLMIQDAILRKKIESLGCTEEEYARYARIGGLYSSLEQFYSEEAPQIKKEVSFGMVRDNIPYDVNLTIEEAYAKYSECDRETSKKTYELLKIADKKAALYEKEIRENYQGDLASQLGYSREEYVEKAKAKDEAWKEAATRFQSKINEMFDNTEPIINHFNIEPPVNEEYDGGIEMNDHPPVDDGGFTL